MGVLGPSPMTAALEGKRKPGDKLASDAEESDRGWDVRNAAGAQGGRGRRSRCTGPTRGLRSCGSYARSTLWRASGAGGRCRPASDHRPSGLWERTSAFPLGDTQPGSGRSGWSADLGFRELLKEAEGLGVCLLIPEGTL